MIRRYLQQSARAAVEARDLKRLNAASEQLNSEAADVMEYRSIHHKRENQALKGNSP